MQELKVISVLVSNRFGALTRVSNVFSRRGVNIKQLTVAETTTKGQSRITILTDAEDTDLRQLVKALKKIEDVNDAVAHQINEVLSREILLVKIAYDSSDLQKIQDLLFDFSGKILYFDSQKITGQIVADTKKINEFLEEIQKFVVLEISRSGITAMDTLHNTFAY